MSVWYTVLDQLGIISTEFEMIQVLKYHTSLSSNKIYHQWNYLGQLKYVSTQLTVKSIHISDALVIQNGLVKGILDFKFSQQWLWRVLFSGIEHCVLSWKSATIWRNVSSPCCGLKSKLTKDENEACGMQQLVTLT